MLKRFNYAAILLGSLALGITMSATGCGDSGDTTPSSSVSNNKTAGPVTVQLDSKAQEIIATNNITNVEYLFTDKDGKQVKLTSQQITPTNSSKKLGKAEAKDGRVDTKTTTITIEGVPKVSTEVVAVYYSDNGEIAALQCSKLDWTSTVTISSGALYDARNANYTFDASAELVLDIARRARTDISHDNARRRADQRINEFHGFGILGQQIHGVANASGNRNVCNQPDCLQQYGDKNVLLIPADESE